MTARQPTPQRATHRDIDAVAWIGLVAIALGAARLGIWPIFEREEEQRTLARELSASHLELASTQAEYGAIRKALVTTAERLRASSVVLHTADRLAERQEEISQAMSSCGISLEQVIVGSIQKGDLLDTVPIHLSGSAAYPRVVAAMHEFRSRFPDMAVTSFQLGAGGAGPSARAGGPDEMLVRFEFDMDWYTARSDRPGE